MTTDTAAAELTEITRRAGARITALFDKVVAVLSADRKEQLTGGANDLEAFMVQSIVLGAALKMAARKGRLNDHQWEAVENLADAIADSFRVLCHNPDCPACAAQREREAKATAELQEPATALVAAVQTAIVESGAKPIPEDHRAQLVQEVIRCVLRGMRLGGWVAGGVILKIGGREITATMRA